MKLTIYSRLTRDQARKHNSHLWHYIKQKKAWNICFIIWHQPQTRSGRIKTNKTQQISAKTQVFFVKTGLHFILFLLIFFSEIYRIRIFLTWNWQLIRDWREIMQENMIHIYDITIMTAQGCNNFQLFNLG